MLHPASHLIVGVTAFAVTLAISGFTVNRLVRRKLRVSKYLLLAYTLIHVVLAIWRGGVPQEAEILGLENIVLTAALINLLVVLLLNPLRADVVPDRFPSIVQDAIVIGLLMLVATFAFDEKFLTTSAVSAVVVGFALQDTLGNAFAGLAIQSEKPFNIGHWISVGGHQGRVAEVTWRATKLRTKTGNFVIVPNSEVSKAPIINYSEPASPTRLYVDVGVTYDAPPNAVKAAITEALRNCPLVLRAPAPDAMINDFAASAIVYRVRFWTDDFERDEEATDQVRSSLFYAFKRRGIEIPYPIQVEYSREMPVIDEAARRVERERLLGGIDLFAVLNDADRVAMAARARTIEFADGERIVGEGEPGQSMYIVASGRVHVWLEGAKTAIATIAEGGYFGEMSLLTGEPRTATVVAEGDVRVLEIDAELFRQLAQASPRAVEQVGVAAATRRAELTAVRASAKSAATIEPPANFIARMRKFLKL